MIALFPYRDPGEGTKEAYLQRGLLFLRHFASMDEVAWKDLASQLLTHFEKEHKELLELVGQLTDKSVNLEIEVYILKKKIAELEARSDAL